MAKCATVDISPSCAFRIPPGLGDKMPPKISWISGAGSQLLNSKRTLPNLELTIALILAFSLDSLPPRRTNPQIIMDSIMLRNSHRRIVISFPKSRGHCLEVFGLEKLMVWLFGDAGSPLSMLAVSDVYSVVRSCTLASVQGPAASRA